MARDEHTRKFRLAGWVVAIAFGVVGCNRDGADPHHAPVATPGTETQQEGQPSASDAIAPRFAELELFVNNGKWGGTNGCSTTFTLVTGTQHPTAAPSAIEHVMHCGHPGAVSKITWSYSGTDARGDHLRLERTFPHEEPNADTTTIEIVFAGESLTVFEDDFQRVIVRVPTRADPTSP
jgi:hypothetical protein